MYEYRNVDNVSVPSFVVLPSSTRKYLLPRVVFQLGHAPIACLILWTERDFRLILVSHLPAHRELCNSSSFRLRQLLHSSSVLGKGQQGCQTRATSLDSNVTIASLFVFCCSLVILGLVLGRL